jgi:hypothetical protein
MTSTIQSPSKIAAIISAIVHEMGGRGASPVFDWSE